MDKTTSQLQFEKGDIRGNYKIEAIRDNAVYVRESKSQLLSLHFLVSWKSYFEEENIWDFVSAI